MFANKKDAKAIAVQSTESNVTSMTKQAEENLETELLTSGRKLRSEAHVTHFKLSNLNKAQRVTSSPALGKEKTPISSTSNSATNLTSLSKFDFKEASVTSPAAASGGSATYTVKTAALAATLASSVKASSSTLPNVTDTHDVPLPAIEPLGVELIVHVETTDQDDEMAEAISPSLFMGLPYDEAQTWYTGLLDFIEYKAMADDKKLSLFKLRLGGYARDWLMSLPDDQKNAFDRLTTI